MLRVRKVWVPAYAGKSGVVVDCGQKLTGPSRRGSNKVRTAPQDEGFFRLGLHLRGDGRVVCACVSRAQDLGPRFRGDERGCAVEA